MTTPPRARQLGGDSLWLAAALDERAADRLWSAPADGTAFWPARLRAARHAVLACGFFGKRLARRSLLAWIAATVPPAHAGAILWVRAVSRRVAAFRERVEDAVAACGLVVRRERSSTVRRRHEEEERAEIAASFQASDWRRRIGGQ